MAKSVGSFQYKVAVRKKTSIGQSVRSKPTNKHKRRNFKRYRGQGR